MRGSDEARERELFRELAIVGLFYFALGAVAGLWLWL